MVVAVYLEPPCRKTPIQLMLELELFTSLSIQAQVSIAYMNLYLSVVHSVMWNVRYSHSSSGEIIGPLTTLLMSPLTRFESLVGVMYQRYSDGKI